MHLADPTKLRDATGFDDMPDINAAIDGALNAAEAMLAGQLGTDFDRVTLTDTFYVSEPGYTDGAHTTTEFKLSRGFVQDLLTVWSAKGRAYLAMANTRIDLIGAFDLDVLKREKGVIVDTGSRYRADYVQVAYTAGFEEDPDVEGRYKLDQVPRWLQEAAKVQAQILLADQKIMEQAGISLDKAMLATQLGGLIGKKLRYAPMSMLPL